jgi:hypothetical protein
LGVAAEALGGDGGVERAERGELVARRRVAHSRARRDGAKRQRLEPLLLKDGQPRGDQRLPQVAMVVGPPLGRGLVLHVSDVNFSLDNAS